LAEAEQELKKKKGPALYGAEVRRKRNKSVRTALKTHVTTAEHLVAKGDKESAQQAVKKAVKALDRAAGTRTIHANAAARRKSRLMKKLNNSAAPKAVAS